LQYEGVVRVFWLILLSSAWLQFWSLAGLSFMEGRRLSLVHFLNLSLPGFLFRHLNRLPYNYKITCKAEDVKPFCKSLW
jgi:hypothetical protein